MIAALLVTRKAKAIAILFGLLVLAAVISLAARHTVLTIDGWITRAAEAAETAERERWKAAIEKSNREVAEAHAARQSAVAALEAGAGAEIAALRQQLTSLETQNATLPGADRCGIDRDRVRLLR